MRHCFSAPLIGSLTLVLSSCAASAPLQQLPPQEVLERASLAADALPSAAFSLDATLNHIVPGWGAVTLEANGRLQHGGRRLFSALTVHIDDASPGTSASQVDAEILLDSEAGTYFRLLHVAGDALLHLADGQAIPTGRWWLVGEPSQGMQKMTDPFLLQMHSPAVHILTQPGMTTLNGRPMYHYDLAVDPRDLRTSLEDEARARGEPFDEQRFTAIWGTTTLAGSVWIDAETFTIARLEWTATPLQAGGLEGAVTIRFSPGDTVDPIALPDDAQLFPTLDIPKPLPPSA